MDAFTVLQEVAGGVELTPDQMAQVRALNVRYYTALFQLQQLGAGGGGGGEDTGVEPAERLPGDAQRARSELEATLTADVEAVLTAAQRRGMRGG